MGPLRFTIYFLVGVGFHDVSHALLADDLGDDIVAQRANCVGGVGQAAAAEIQLVVGVHLREGEDLAAALWGLLGEAPAG